MKLRTRIALPLALLLFGAGVVSPHAALAQGAPLTLPEMALEWASGNFGSPLICQIDDRPIRGLRRLSIAPDPRLPRQSVYRITFTDLEIGDASRCFTELEPEVPNVVGSVQIRLPGTYRADTAERDFREVMRRKRGFEFEITEGLLGIQPVKRPLEPAKRVRFAGGKARLYEVKPGTDSARLLAGFDAPRKLLLELEAKDGTTLAFPLYVTEGSPRESR